MRAHTDPDRIVATAVAPPPSFAALRSSVSINEPLAVQAKLTVNQPQDKYELEADRIAERVVRMPEPHFGQADSGVAIESCKGGEQTVQRVSAQRERTQGASSILTIAFGGAWDHTRPLGLSNGPVELVLIPHLRSIGRDVEYFEWTDSSEAEDYIISRVNEDPGISVELIGHSYGGDTAISVANDLVARGINVIATITLDPVGWIKDDPAASIRWVNAYVQGVENLADFAAVAGGRYGERDSAENIKPETEVRHENAIEMYKVVEEYLAFDRYLRNRSPGTAAIRAPQEQQGHIQRSSTTPATMSVPTSVHSVIDSSGTKMDSATLAFMEPRFGQDFSRVRVHTDSKAARSAADIHARAYTVGNHIVFGQGESPSRDKQLLAHELTHVLQQRSVSSDY